MIRQATEDDLFDLMVLAKEFTSEAPSQYNWNRHKIEESLRGAITRPDMLAAVYEQDGEAKGFLIAIASELFMSEKRAATELAWFVSKDYRGSSASVRLITTFENWAKEANCDFTVMADLNSLADLSAIYTKRGYKLVERSYLKEL